MTKLKRQFNELLQVSNKTLFLHTDSDCIDSSFHLDLCTNSFIVIGEL